MQTGILIYLISTLFILGGAALKIFHLVDSSIGWMIILIGTSIPGFSLTLENKNLKKRIKELEKSKK